MSFERVEYKIYETDYFLEKIKGCIDIYEIQFLFSAFLSAIRSITFTLQACMKSCDGFSTWYEEKQLELKENTMAREFVRMRNMVQKTGEHFISGGKYFIDQKGKRKCGFYINGDVNEFQLIKSLVDPTPDEQIDYLAEKCEQYFILLLKIIRNCYKTFGHIIDPEKYYTWENIKRLGFSIEDIEESLGFPRGYTDIEGFTPDIRLKVLSDSQPKSKIDNIFYKYLECSRYD